MRNSSSWHYDRRSQHTVTSCALHEDDGCGDDCLTWMVYGWFLTAASTRAGHSRFAICGSADGLQTSEHMMVRRCCDDVPVSSSFGSLTAGPVGDVLGALRGGGATTSSMSVTDVACSRTWRP